MTNNEKFIIVASDKEIIYHELGPKKWIQTGIQSHHLVHRIYNTTVVLRYIRGLNMDITEDIVMIVT